MASTGRKWEASRGSRVRDSGRPHHPMTTRTWALGTAPTRAELDAWAEVEAALGVPLIRTEQVHRAGDAAGDQLARVNIIVSNDPGVALAIQAADCVPMLMVDRRSCAVGGAHAGWRGLAASVPRAAVEALAWQFRSRLEDPVVAAGPSIGACCYEVRANVRQRFAVCRIRMA